MKKLLPFILALSIFSCSQKIDTNDFISNDSEIQNNTEKKAKWTVMVYMSGDNDLEEYIVKDLEKELGSVGSTDAIQVVAIADRNEGYDTSRGDWKTTKLFHINKGLKATSESAVTDLGEKNMGDPKTFSDFIDWSKKNYPAENYALYMWGHGWNWHKGFTMEDKTNKDSLDMHEVKSVFDKIGKIDMIAYDGCNMASVEVEALWYGKAKAIVHSQEYVGWDGIEYDTVLKALNKNPNMSAEELAIITNKSASVNKEKTGSAVILNEKYGNLLKTIDDWSVALKKGLKDNIKNYDKAFSKSQHFVEDHENKDLYDLAQKISENVTDPVIKEKSQKVMDAVKASVIDEWHIEKQYPNVHGITISKVKPTDEQRQYYKTLDFTKKVSNWDSFLTEYNK